MSEELAQKRLTKYGLKVGNYQFYNIGNTTLNQLKKYKIIPKRNYKEYGIRRPDALLVDRRDENNIKVILVIEYKSGGKFTSPRESKEATQQCNDLCQELAAEVGIATDNNAFTWFNPNQIDPHNDYLDPFNKQQSYTIVKDENGNDFIKEFVIDQKQDEQNVTKTSARTLESLKNLELIRRHLSAHNSQITEQTTIDPTSLAKQIWQDVWSVSGATPERCLYTFLELFIFKYLSDLGILNEDDKGNRINFQDIFSLQRDKAFKNYYNNVRPYLKLTFPENPEDGTTIINGTVLSPDVPEHSIVFYKLLKRFDDFGELRRIDPSFKSKVFEVFMKETISKKNWGQFFTPRNIIDAIIEISDIASLQEGSEICDPACGVGGFILEPMKVRENGVNFYYRIEEGRIQPRYRFYGYDKGFEKDEQLIIILAKANMLIFVSELLKSNPTLLEEFSLLFNSTFRLLSKTILGTLSRTEKDRYDLILTNPPYVTSGSSNTKDAIMNEGRLKEFYKINAFGLEGLFLEWIIRSLKPSRKAFVIIPDGILNRLNDNKLRKFIRDECVLDGIISLPVNAFYRNPKKTYILALTKKEPKSEIERREQIQKDLVYTYIVSNTGETLDVKRFTIPENDLIEMASLFNQFKGAKASFKSPSLRCKIQDIERFDPDKHWSVDRWWTKEEQIELGIQEEETVFTLQEFREEIDETLEEFEEMREALVRFE